ncbi:hypothetical protein [Chryseobacterium salivictor]
MKAIHNIDNNQIYMVDVVTNHEDNNFESNSQLETTFTKILPSCD